MIKKLLIYFLTLIIFLTSLQVVSATSLEDCEKGSTDSECVEILQKKINELSDQENTLSKQLTQFDSQIQITKLKISDSQSTIEKLEKEITALGARIGFINTSLDKLEILLKKRIVATYEQSYISNLELLLTSNGFSDLILKAQYLKQVQENDRRILLNLQQTKANYANQKDERETKQAQIEESKKKLESLKIDLDKEKAAKQILLKLTQNDENRYQQLLAQALAEKKAIGVAFAEAISRLNAGEGTNVSEGQTIALVGNSGAPTCSSGPHLHFMVTKDGVAQNPASYLKDVSPGWDNPDAKPAFSGSWNWPISNPTVTQIFGKSYYVVNFGWYGGGIHDGIDMVGGSTIVAPRSGKLIIGSTYCGSSALKYAAVKHNDDSEIVTLYLHIQ